MDSARFSTFDSLSTSTIDTSLLPRKYNVCGTFPCNQCGRSYKYRRNLLAHLRQECGKGPLYQCKHCNRCFRQSGNLTRHMRAAHRSMIVASCNVALSRTSETLETRQISFWKNKLSTNHITRIEESVYYSFNFS